jgi:hypothetical protein
MFFCVEMWGLAKDGNFIRTSSRFPFGIGSSDMYDTVMADVIKARSKSNDELNRFQNLFVSDEEREERLLLLFLSDLMS